MPRSTKLLPPHPKNTEILYRHGGRLRLNLVDVANHVERALRKVVVGPADDLIESLDGIREADELTGRAGEDLGDVEGLAHELLDLARAANDELVVLRQLVHAEDGNDVLQALVILEELLGGSRDLVVLLPDDAGVEHAGGGVEGVDCRVNSKLGNRAGEHGGGVEMRECRGGGRIGEIVGGDVDGLDRCDGPLRRGGDALLQGSHVRGECGLVPDGRGDAPEQSRHLGTGLGEAEDVVHEEKHVLALLVAEVLGDGQTREGDASAGAGGLVHLAVNERGLGAGGGPGLLVDLDDPALNHLVVEIVTLARALSDPGEDGITTVVHGDVVDELHDDDRLPDSCTPEEADLAPLRVWGQQVDDLDAGDEDLLRLSLLSEGGGGAVEGCVLLGALHGEDGALLVHGLADDVDDAAEGLGADGYLDRLAGVGALLAADETVRGLHGNGADGVLAEVLRDLEDEAVTLAVDLEGVENLGKLLIELVLFSLMMFDDVVWGGCKRKERNFHSTIE